jgi:sporulation protein YhbH
MGDSVFRSYSEADGLRSDRSARDRQRHRQKVREAIRENIADVIAEEAIIGRSGDRIIKVPIRGIREYRFIYGDNEPGVGSGDGDTEPGQVIGRAGDGQRAASDGPGDQPGVDHYETEVSLEELVDIMFEDLELPEMDRKRLREIPAATERKRQGYRRVGVRVHLDKKRTAKARIRRKVARRAEPDGEERFPFHPDDLTYRRLVREEVPHSNAVVICIMDTSGSMDTMKKYLARSFFFLLYQFVRTRYRNVEVVFVAHDAHAVEVNEQEFFHKSEAGGTLISTGYRKALEIIENRYPPELWNVYAFHCSDGDNWSSDNDDAVRAARELCEVSNLFGYGEIKPLNSGRYGHSMLPVLEEVDAPNFQTVKLERREDLWPGFKSLLSRECIHARSA